MGNSGLMRDWKLPEFTLQNDKNQCKKSLMYFICEFTVTNELLHTVHTSLSLSSLSDSDSEDKPIVFTVSDVLAKGTSWPKPGGKGGPTRSVSVSK